MDGEGLIVAFETELNLIGLAVDDDLLQLVEAEGGEVGAQRFGGGGERKKSGGPVDFFRFAGAAESGARVDDQFLPDAGGGPRALAVARLGGRDFGVGVVVVDGDIKGKALVVDEALFGEPRAVDDGDEVVAGDGGGVDDGKLDAVDVLGELAVTALVDGHLGFDGEDAAEAFAQKEHGDAEVNKNDAEMFACSESGRCGRRRGWSTEADR